MPRTLPLRLPGTKRQSIASPSGTPDKYADKEHADATDDYLEGCAQKWRVHVAVANPADHQQLDRDHEHRERGGGAKVRNQVRQRVADASGSCHQPTDDAAQKRFAATG